MSYTQSDHAFVRIWVQRVYAISTIWFLEKLLAQHNLNQQIMHFLICPHFYSQNFILIYEIPLWNPLIQLTSYPGSEKFYPTDAPWTEFNTKYQLILMDGGKSYGGTKLCMANQKRNYCHDGEYKIGG